MSEAKGVAIAIVSCSLGAGAAVATRYLIGAADPFTLAAIRFGGGAVCLLPLVFLVPVRWPPRPDWLAVAALGFAFYAAFFVLYNVALGFTTVARGTLALSTLPLMTMIAARALGFEPLSARKSGPGHAGRRRRPGSGVRGGATGRLARRSHHDGCHFVHGAL